MRKRKMMGILERVLLGAAMGCVLYLAERRLNKMQRARTEAD